MATFLNIDFSGKVSTKNILRHTGYTLMWALYFALIVLRADTLLIDPAQYTNHLYRLALPLLYLAIMITLVVRQKWYNTLALTIYPLLILFWFLPKLILRVGRFYALLYYVDFIFQRFKKFKRTLLMAALSTVCLLLFFFIDHWTVSAITMLLFCYLFIRFLAKYYKNSFLPVQTLGSTFSTVLAKPASKPTILIESLENLKDDEKLDSETNRQKRVERLVITNYCLGYLAKRLEHYRGRKAYMLFALIQLVIYVFIGLFFFTFINYQLYQISPSNFSYTTPPGVFDFFYYSIKNITFSNPDDLKPLSALAKVVEISAFLVFSLFLLIIAVSHLVSLRNQKVDEGLQLAVQNFEQQTRSIELYVRDTYQVEVSQAAGEIASIKKSLDNLRKIIDQIV